MMYRLTVLISSLFLMTNISIAKTYSEAWELYIENDSKNLGGPGTDSRYTNGVKFSYLFKREKPPFWSGIHRDFYSLAGVESSTPFLNYGFSFGHQIFTPENTQEKGLVSGDRPYAGWAYLSFSSNIADLSKSHFIDLSIGTIGPAALGEETQKEFHRFIDTSLPQGWDNQLENEMTIQLSYERKQQQLQWSNADIASILNTRIGNVYIVAGGGAIARVGINLEEDYVPSRPSSSGGEPMIKEKEKISHKKSAYLFAGISANYFLHNIFLDGNTFSESHSVSKIPLVAEYEIGLAGDISNWSVAWRYVNRTPEFKERRESHQFASLSIRYTQ